MIPLDHELYIYLEEKSVLQKLFSAFPGFLFPFPNIPSTIFIRLFPSTKEHEQNSLTLKKIKYFQGNPVNLSSRMMPVSFKTKGNDIFKFIPNSLQRTIDTHVLLAIIGTHT